MFATFFFCAQECVYTHTQSFVTKFKLIIYYAILIYVYNKHIKTELTF